MSRLKYLVLVLPLVMAGCEPVAEQGRETDPDPGRAIRETPWDQVAQEATLADEILVAALVEKDPGAVETLRKESTFPVLLPDDPEFIRRMSFNLKSHLYAAIANYPDHRVQINAIHSGKPDGEVPVTFSKDQAELTFHRWGTTYRIVIRSDDARRASDAGAIETLRRSLVWIKPS